MGDIADMMLDGTLEAGKTYRTIWPCNGKSEPTLCEAGMHGSLRAIDALEYAPGNVVSLTEIYGNVETSKDKIVGESRKILAIANVEDELRMRVKESGPL